MRNHIYADLQIAQILYDDAKNRIHEFDNPELVMQLASEHLIKHKKKWRNWLKQQNDNHYEWYKNGYIVNGGGEWDCRWIKVFFPGEHWSREKMIEFSEDNWKECRYSAYDCTGDIFTSRISCFNVPSGVVVYIKENMDI